MADLIIDDVVKVYNESGKNNGSMIIDGGGLQCRRITYENVISTEYNAGNDIPSEIEISSIDGNKINFNF